MSYTIVYGLRTTKVTALVGDTVGGLTEQAKKSFKLAPETFVELHHKGKALDSSKPLRFTNLVNNAKLELKVVEGKDSEVVLKVTVISPEGAISNHLITTKVSTTAHEFISSIELENGIKILAIEGYKAYLMGGVNHKVMQEDFASTRLGSIIGFDTKRAGLRLAYSSENNQKLLERQKEQQEVVRKQLIAQKEWQQKIASQEETKRLEEARMQAEKAVPNNTESVRESYYVDPVHMNVPDDNSPMAELTASDVGEDTEKPIESSLKDDLPKEPQMYLPADSHNVYEHNDDVYNMTVAQAQAYHQLITKSLRPHKHIQPVKHVPNRYTIRVKFPDRVTLQLLFEHGNEVKLGALLKKLDELILPEFRNSYILKFASPPFTAIPFNFTTNNTLLHELKVSKNPSDVFSERTSLIFESKLKSKGPFVIQNDVLVKNQLDRPEVQVESSRSTMPTDMELPIPSSRSEPVTEKKRSSKGTPKWLKIGKN